MAEACAPCIEHDPADAAVGTFYHSGSQVRLACDDTTARSGYSSQFSEQALGILDVFQDSLRATSVKCPSPKQWLCASA
jgi:hypothetical protein